MLEKPNKRYIETIIKKPLIGNTFRQFKFSLIAAMVLGIMSLILMAAAIFLKLSDNFFWLAIIICFCSVLFILVLSKKLKIFENEMTEQYRKKLDDNLN